MLWHVGLHLVWCHIIQYSSTFYSWIENHKAQHIPPYLRIHFPLISPGQIQDIHEPRGVCNTVKEGGRVWGVGWESGRVRYAFEYQSLLSISLEDGKLSGRYLILQAIVTCVCVVCMYVHMQAHMPVFIFIRVCSFLCEATDSEEQWDCFYSRIRQSNWLPSWSPFCSQALWLLTHPLLMTVYQALRSLQSFLQVRLHSVEYTFLCKLQGSTDRGPWCSHPGEAAIKPSLLRMTRNFPSPCFSVLICKCRAYSPGSSLFQWWIQEPKEQGATS